MRLLTTTALSLAAIAIHNPALAGSIEAAPTSAASTPIATLTAPTLSPATAPTIASVGEVEGKAFSHVDLKPITVTEYLASRSKGQAKAVPANLVRLKKRDSAGARSTDKAGTVSTQALRAGDATAAEPPVDIAELARALKNDPDLIYEFVRDNIEINPVYGIQKGAWGALIDRQGSNFDQIELMVRLLRASGYEANYVLGVIQLSAAQIQDNFGISTAKSCAVRDYFAAGQTPSNFYINGSTCNDPLNYALLMHMWARVTINGQTYDFDPSLKSHQNKAGIGIAAASGYSQTQLLADAKVGATVTSTSAKNLNRQNVRDRLAGYSMNLVNTIRSTAPAASVDDIIGGKAIVQNENPMGTPTRNTVLPVARTDYSTTIFTDEIPVDLRSIVQIAFGSVNVAFLADDYYGARITVAPNANFEPQLIADGEVIATSGQLLPGYFQGLQVGIQHLAYSDINADQTVGRPLHGGETFAISYALGTATDRLTKTYRDQMAAAVDAGNADGSEPVLGAQLAAVGADLNAQLGMSVLLTDRAARTNTQMHHSLGLVSQLDGAPNVNFAMSNTVQQEDLDEGRRVAAIISHTMHGSALESGVLEQSTDVPAVSSIHFIDKAVRDGATIYDATSANFTSEVRPNMLNCSSQELAGLQTYPDAGWRLILPNNCRQVEGDWVGNGVIALSPDTSNLSVGMQISGGYNGGFSSRRNRPVLKSKLANPRKKKPGKKRGDPVEMTTGAFVYGYDDLVTGQGGFPRSLSMTRSYNSASALTDGPLGRGWSHNLSMKVSQSSDAYQGLGQDSPIDAASSIVEALITIDLLSDPSRPFDKMTVAALGNRWWIDQLRDNAANVTTDEGGQAHIRLADGTYNAPPADSSKLIRNADGTFTQTSADKTSYQFDSAGNLAVRREPNGLEVRFGYLNGQLTSVQNSLGRSLAFNYVGERISSVQDGNGRSVSYAYDAAGNLASVLDVKGNSTTFEYDLPGRMTKFFLPANPAVPQVVNTYDTLGRVAQQVDADGKLWQYHIAGTRGELVSPLGNRAVDYFDGDGNTIATLEDINPGDGVTSSWDRRLSTFKYDGRGRLIQSTDSADPMVRLTYDDATCSGAELRCTHNVTVRRKVAVHKATDTATLPDEVQTFTYEPQFNQLASLTDERGKVTNFAYDSAGNLTGVTRPPAVDGGSLRPTTSFGYSTFVGVAGYPSFTLPTSVTRAIDANSSVTNRTTYDPNNGYVPASDVVDSGGLNLTTSYGHDAVGNLTSVDGPRADVADITSLGYDAERKVTSVTDALGKSTLTTYDADGDLTGVAQQLGTEWVKSCYTRSPSGNITRIVGPATVAAASACPAAIAPNKVVDLAYDDDGRLLTNTVRLSDLEGGDRVTQLGYTPSGSVISVRSAVGSELDQMTERGRISYTSGFSQMRWHSARNNGALPNSAASVIREFNAHGRETQAVVRASDGASSVCGSPGGGCDQYGYDTAGNLTSWTRRDGQALAYAFDNLGRVTQRTGPTAATTVSYTYDLLDRVLSATNGGRRGASVSFAYDKAGRMVSTTSDGRTVAYQYDAAGNRTRTTWPGASFAVTYDFDALNRVSAIRENGTTLLASYGYDDLSRRTSVTYGNGTSVAYGYDAQARLGSQTLDLAGTTADVSRTISRNQAGEITALTTSNAIYDWSGHYNVSRPYTSDAEEKYLTSGSKALTYDGRGNLASDGTWKFTFDALNRLESAIVKNVASLTYTYDPLGRLASRQSGRKSISNYLYDGNQLLAEYDSSGNLVRRFVPGPTADDHLVVYDGTGAATRSWLYPDERGSIIATADGAGNPTATMTYGPFGEPGGSTGVALRYTGQIFDAESGLYFYKARWYSPFMGRFLSPDPAMFIDGLQTYSYVSNDPVNWIDPSGLKKQGADPDGSCKDTGSETDAIRRVGDGLANVGSGLEVLGAGVGAVFPPAGAYIGGAGLLMDGAGNLLTAYANYSDGDYGAIFNQGLDFGVSKLTGGLYKTAAKGSIAVKGKKGFQPNPLGGKYKDAKAEAVGIGAGKAASGASGAIMCAVKGR